MTNSIQLREVLKLGVAALLVLLPAGQAEAKIDGVEATIFNFTVREDLISTPDGGRLVIWGLADDTGTGRAQYPGPTMIVHQGQTITVNLTNSLLNRQVSLMFPGQDNVTATGGVPGLLVQEAAAGGGTVTYTFQANEPGTYMYYSGTDPGLQIELGMFGAIIVRPTGYDHMAPTAYGTPASAYTHEVLFLISEMDPRINELIISRRMEALPATDLLSNYVPNYWFLNGRAAPDTMLPAFFNSLPTQPYDCMPMMHPGEKILMRVATAGRDLHPFHHHGNHARIIAKDGRPLEVVPGSLDQSYEVFTIPAVPGETVDALFSWTGVKLGWDIYGSDAARAHDCMDHDGDDYDDMTWEYCPDHGKPIPVELPDPTSLTFGGMWPGSPYLGGMGSLPPGEGGMNPHAGFSFMWHSHNEKEMVNYDLFPGGMMTMLMIVPHTVPIMH